MSSVENVSVGDFIVVTETRYRADFFTPPPFQGEWIPAINEIDPVPLQVKGVAAPYLMCERVQGEGKSEWVDSRFVSWSKIETSLVLEYCKLNKLDVPDDAKTEDQLKSDIEDKKKRCPLCQEPMSERMKEIGNWNLICNPCGVELVKMT